MNATQATGNGSGDGRGCTGKAWCVIRNACCVICNWWSSRASALLARIETTLEVKSGKRFTIYAVVE
jgi:hypothetical protein